MFVGKYNALLNAGGGVVTYNHLNLLERRGFLGRYAY
jgi:hypothetical protein